MCYYRKIKLDQCITFGRRPPCKFFSKISESRRQEAFLDERWWWLIFDEITSAHLIDDYREGKNKEVYKTSVDNSHGKETEISLKICPNCSKKSIWKNYSTQLLECLNHNCKRKFTEKEYILALQTRGR
jgi:ribosomal protein L37AE/L43A